MERHTLPVNDCLTTAVASPRFPGILPGLAVDVRGQISVAADACSMCGGTGLRLLPREETTAACVLPKRLARVRALIDLYHHTHQRSVADEMLIPAHSNSFSTPCTLSDAL